MSSRQQQPRRPARVRDVNSSSKRNIQKGTKWAMPLARYWTTGQKKPDCPSPGRSTRQEDNPIERENACCQVFRPGNELTDGEVFSGRNHVRRKVHYTGEKEMSPSQGSQRPSLTARVSPGTAFGGGLISVWNAKSSISTFIVRSRASSATASKTSPIRP